MVVWPVASSGIPGCTDPTPQRRRVLSAAGSKQHSYSHHTAHWNALATTATMLAMMHGVRYAQLAQMLDPLPLQLDVL